MVTTYITKDFMRWLGMFGKDIVFTRMRYLGILELVLMVERGWKFTPPLGEKRAFYRSPQNLNVAGKFTPEVLA
jgi:hypothetical protein